MLTEVKTDTLHYFIDEHAELNGEYKQWYGNGQLNEHCFYKDNNLHGECKRWYSSGQLGIHCFYENDGLHGEYKNWYGAGQLCAHFFFDKGNDITRQVKALVNDINNITEEEKFLIKLNFGIPLC